MNYVNTIYNYNRISYGDSTKSYLNDLYYYYYNNGYYSIIANKITNLSIGYLLLIIINILTNCIDYNGLLLLSNNNFTYVELSQQPVYLSSYIDIKKWFPKSSYLIICFILYVIYLFCNSINFYNSLKKFRNIKNVFNTDLNIRDNKLQFITWDKIISRIKLIDTDNTLNIYTVNNRITNQANIIISLLRSNYLTIPNLSKFLEWNFIYCIIDPISYLKPFVATSLIQSTPTNINTNTNTNINTITDINNTLTGSNGDTNSINLVANNLRNLGINPDEYIKRVKTRINLVVFINLLSLPFSFIIMGIYTILSYGNKIYHNPAYVFKRQLDIKIKWQLHYYNELPNLFEERINRIEQNLDMVISKYSPSILKIFYRLTTFLLGSIFITLFIISIISNRDPLQIWIFKEKSIVWFLGIIGSLVIISNNNAVTNNKYSDNRIKIGKTETANIIKQLREDLATINPQLLKTDDDEELINIIKNIYPYKVTLLLNEIWYFITSPYYLYKWYNEITSNYQYIIGLIDYHHQLGCVSKYSIFTNITELNRNSHMLLSVKAFKLNHPNWELPAIIQYDLGNTVLLENLRTSQIVRIDDRD